MHRECSVRTSAEKKTDLLRMCSYYRPNGALESQNTSSQDWLEDICGRDALKLPLFLPEPEFDPPIPEDQFLPQDSDSDKENKPPPPLHVPGLPWPQRHHLAEVLTRVASSHEAISTGMLEIRDIILGIGHHDDDSEDETPRERNDGVSRGLGDSMENDTDSVRDGHGLVRESVLNDGSSSSSDSEAGGETTAASVRKTNASLSSGGMGLAGSVASVLVTALNTKRKAAVVPEGDSEWTENPEIIEGTDGNTAQVRRRPTRRPVPIPTESQAEREETRHREYEERRRQRIEEGLPPRKPKRRRVLDFPATSAVPTSQDIYDLFGDTPASQRLKAVTQSGFRRD